MDVTVLGKGLVLGFSIAAPVGPIGVLCIRRSISGGRALGFVSGLGAATADALYGSMAAFGLTAISGLLISHQVWLRLVGGGFLLYLGIRAFGARPPESPDRPEEVNLFGAYATAFLLTLTNPMTIVSFAAIFAGLGLTTENYLEASLLVAGVFAGSALWWLILSGLSAAFRSSLQPRTMGWINRVSGLVIIGFGVLAVRTL